MTHSIPASADTVAAALRCIPAAVPRDQWVSVGMAIKSEFPDAVGLELFDQWSASAGDGYDPKAVRDTWRSLKQSGGKTIGTLFHLAKENGFTMPKTTSPQATAPDPEAAQAAALQRAAQAAHEAKATEAAHADAAGRAAGLWDSATQALAVDAAPYLVRKGAQPYGVRCLPDGVLLVPLRDGAGTLWNVQTIDALGNKRFLAGGRKSGLWHWCGDPVGASVLLVAEGYATAATLHEATGRPVAVAFDAGNVGKVAHALAGAFAGALVVLGGDDDAATHEKTGRNPGRDAATAAARKVRGLAVFPHGLADGGSDFNDLGKTAGLQAVRSIVEAAIEAHQSAAHQADQTVPGDASAAPAGKGGRASDKRASAPKNGAGGGGAGGAGGGGGAAAGGAAGADADAADRFILKVGEGLYYRPPGKDDFQFVCPELQAVGLACDGQGNQAAYLLEFFTTLGVRRRWLMPLAMLAGDGAAYRSALLQMGFMSPTSGFRRAWLTEYLQTRQTATLPRITHVPRVGWHGRCYVLPHETLGTMPAGESIMFFSEAGVEANFSQRGELGEWKQKLARLAVNNTRAAFAVSTAFAGPLLPWADGTGGGGVHYVGPTSIGKTTCFLLASSVWGKGTETDPASYMQKWRATSNGLEYQGEQHNHCTLILDELGQMDANEAGVSAYMLADGQGKTRSRGNGGNRPKPTWKLLFLSSGELTLAQHMATAGKKVKSGQDVRMLAIPTEVAPGTALECFHEFGGGHESSGEVQRHAARVYGVAGRAWLEYLVAHTEGLRADLSRSMRDIEQAITPPGAVGEVKRAARRMALIAAAGEMATEAGLTGWPQGEAVRAARACFADWLGLRGGAGSSESARMLQQVREFLQVHGEGRFTWWHRAGDDHAPKSLNRAGFRRMLSATGEPIKSNAEHLREYGETMETRDAETMATDYFIFDEVFKNEVCKGYDYRRVCDLLLEHECLVREVPHLTKKPRLPGMGPTRVFHITPAILELDL